VSDVRRRARLGLGIYFAVLVPVSALLEGLIIRSGDAIQNHPGLTLSLMWTPALASLVARGALREGARDVSFRLGGRRAIPAYLTALLVPVIVGAVAYGVAWSTGLSTFTPSDQYSFVANPALRLLVSLVLATTVGTFFSCISAAGEEIGWRGYMLTRLIDAGVPAPILTSGLIWGLWHVPLIVSGQYAAGDQPWLSALLFLLMIVPAAFLFARVRLHSGSVWPAVIAHAAWNTVIQAVFDRWTTGAESARWVGESGVLVVLTMWVLVGLVWRSGWLAAAPAGVAQASSRSEAASAR